jgi:hypothetical protein
MVDLLAAKRARMACRIYLKLFDAGPEGAPILKEDADGPRDDPSADMAVAVEVIARFVDDTILDEPGHKDGVPHYALTAGMRARMAAPRGGTTPPVERIRADIARADRGEDVPAGDWLDAEAFIRTGQTRAEPL